MRTSAVIDCVPSLIASGPLCECSSMMPGVTHLFVASMIFAPAGTCTLVPTSAILPFRIRIVPFMMLPWLAVMMLAWVIATSVPAGGTGSVSGSKPPVACGASCAPPTDAPNEERCRQGAGGETKRSGAAPNGRRPGRQSCHRRHGFSCGFGGVELPPARPPRPPAGGAGTTA